MPSRPPIFACLLLLCAACEAFAAEWPPNIVLVITDDQGWGDLSLHGNANIRTPNIDALARAGAQFERFYVSPVCAPTRASLLTGRYHPRTGVTGVTRGDERMNLDEVTLADLLKANGYATGAFGKWHNGSQYPYHPNGRGFDEFYGFCSGHWSNYFDTLLERNGEEVRGKGYVNNDFTNHAIEFVDANRARPFFCYLAFNTPHSPFQVPDEDFDRVKQRGLTMFSDKRELEVDVETISALAMCENIDWNVGRLLGTLDNRKLANDTIVLYMTDNGPNTWRWNGGMKGRKASVDEGGVRSPLFIRWPGKVRKQSIDKIASHIDILPTLVDLAGIDVSKSPRKPKPIDGLSLKPFLFTNVEQGSMTSPPPWPERMIYSTFRDKTSVRTARYRADADSLFDMFEDPGQRQNLAKKKPDVHRQLVEAIQAWERDVKSDLAAVDERPYPVGAAERMLTVLPAQDCEFHGEGLKYSAPPPNSSWLTGWTTTDAYPTWDIDVLTAGRYEVALKYTCAEDAIGTELELSFSDRTLRSKLTDAYDPPLIDSPDHVERKESYEKPFAQLSLGEIDLPAGRGLLTLKALSKPGAAVMDMRAIELRRK